jgi:hypothetical protein
VAAGNALAVFDANAWAPAANTLLLVVLTFVTRRTGRHVRAARKEAEAGRLEAAYTARVVKESHNDLIDVLTRKYEDKVDGITHRFEPRRREDDPS